MKQYEFTPLERRVIMAALEYTESQSEIRTRLTDYDKATIDTECQAVLDRFAEDTCWDKFEGEA